MATAYPSETAAKPIRFWSAVVLGFVLTEVAMIASAFLWVFFYSIAIHTTGDQAHYDAYAKIASPVVAVVCAFPIFFAMGRAMRRFKERARFAAMAVVAINLLLDTAVVATLAEDLGYNIGMSILAACGKLAGGLIGSRRRTD